MFDRSQKDIMHGWSANAVPIVSICCITYNHERYIMQAIDSFLMQETDFPFEIVIHDDASTDGTADIILEYVERYPAIIKPILQTENQFSKGGLINPRFVFPKTQGRYIALCEGDDYWTDKTKLQKQVSFLENNSEYAITYTDCRLFDEKGDLKAFVGWGRKDLESYELKKSTPIFTLTACFRNVIKEIPPDLLSARCGDLVIWSLLSAYGRGKYLPDIKPAAYRVHDAGIFSKKDKRKKAEMLLITYNALFAHYTRIGDANTARHFCERSFVQSLWVIGGSRLIIVFIKSLLNMVLNRFRSIL